MIGGEDDFQSILRSARDMRDRNIFKMNLFRSEYNNLILWCFEFRQAFIEASPINFLSIRRRNRIFQTISQMAETRQELPTIDEYFGNRRIGKYKHTIAEMEALEYISAIQDKVMELNDWKITPEAIE